jgi:RNA polymerase sigma-70 factor, ECF subfamily
MQVLRRPRTDIRSNSEVDPDSFLVRAAQGDPRAFGALYDRYYPAVHGYCLAGLRDPDAAADATAQTFLKAITGLARYREQGRFRSWLFAIAHNVIADSASHGRHFEPLEAARQYSDPSPSPDEAVAAGDERMRLYRAVDRLPAADRQVIELRCAGLSGKEIAKALGISHEAAKKRQLRAIERLRLDLQESSFDLEVRNDA